MTTDVISQDDQHSVRLAKLATWRTETKAYPNGFVPSHTAAEIQHHYADVDRDTLSEKPVNVAVSGRMLTRRLMGKASFANVQDGSGDAMQWYLRLQDLPEGQFESYKQWDLGDILFAKGYLFRTKTNELSVYVTEVLLLSKSLWPMPDKFHGLQDQAIRYRQRYLDLMVNPSVRQVFVTRSKIVQAVRQFLTDAGFMEVETPMMQPLAGGAAARPFETHHNALNVPLFLRIAPELYLKRLIVGGFDRVFELNRNFRNEGVSTRHNPEFTMVEFYQAYATYKDLMHLTEQLLRQVILRVKGCLQVPYQGHILDFEPDFKCMTMAEAILAAHPALSPSVLQSTAQLEAWASQQQLAIEPGLPLGKLHVEIFEKTVERTLIQPTFITAYPAICSPLARRSDDDPSLTDRFEFFYVWSRSGQWVF